MPNISVKMSVLKDNRIRINKLTGDLEKITNNLRVIKNSLDGDIRYRSDINSSLNDLFAQLEEEVNRLYRTTRFLDTAIRDYEGSEKAIKNNLNILNGKILAKNTDVFGDKALYDKAKKDNSGDDTQGAIEEGGIVSEALEFLPGGQKPTEAELAQIDAILDKYEQMLAERYDDNVSDTDIKEILDSMVEELTPIFREHRYDFTWWYEIVKPGGALDVKNSRTIDISINGENREVSIWNLPWSYNGEAYQGDFTGNFLYGYLGAEVFGTGELGQAVLKGAGGFAQYLSDKNNPFLDSDPLKKYLESLRDGGWGDNEGDSEQVQLGINSYINNHGSWQKVLDVGKIINPFRIPTIYIPPFIVPDEDDFYSYTFVEDEPGFSRDIELISLITGSIFDTIIDKAEENLPSIPEIVERLDNEIHELIEWSSYKLNDAGEAIEEGINDIVDRFNDAGEAIEEGINDAMDRVNDTGEAIEEGINDALNGMGNLFD